MKSFSLRILFKKNTEINQGQLYNIRRSRKSKFGFISVFLITCKSTNTRPLMQAYEVKGVRLQLRLHDAHGATSSEHSSILSL